MSHELYYRSATELAGLLRAKQISAREVVTAHLDRIEAVNPVVNAIVTSRSPLSALWARPRNWTTWPLAGLSPDLCTACRWRTRTTTSPPASAPPSDRWPGPNSSPTPTTW